MATVANNEDLINAVAAEMSAGIAWAVGAWITEIEAVLDDPSLTTLGRLRAVQEIVQRRKAELQCIRGLTGSIFKGPTG